MRDLKKIVDEYLSSPTEYALQIVGNWGHGKTYYYRNHLENLIKNKEVLNNATKKYKPIYVSLFGLKSTEDIATKIVIEFYESKFFKNYFKNDRRKKKLRITEGILKIGFRGFLAFKGLGNVDEYITDIKGIGKDVLATDELIICFDDLERRNSALDLKDLIGYINSLLDEKVKILLISNQNVLMQNDADYINLKEKIIGITIEYSVNTKSTIQEIIANKFSSFPEFQNFLGENIDLLEEVSKSADNNFRHIIYALSVLHYFFSEFRKNIFDIKHEISEKLNEQIGIISKIILAFAIEYKASHLSYKALEFYLQLFSIGLHPAQNLSIKENKQSKLGLFVEKYKIEQNQYSFYQSIFNYITAVEEFVLSDFIKDFKDKFHLDNGRILPQYELINELSLDNYFNLSDEEFLNKFEKVIGFAGAGIYKPEDYLSIMFLVQRFKDIFHVDFESQYNKLVRGLKTSIENAGDNYEVIFDHFRGGGKSSLYSEYQNKLYDLGMQEIKLYKERKQQDKIHEIVDLFMNNYKEFHYKFISERGFQYEVSEFCFLNEITGLDIIDLVKRSDNGLIKFLDNFLIKRYTNTDLLKAELLPIENFYKLLTEYHEELGKSNSCVIRHHLVEELLNNLSKLLKRP
jgi:hypothetical protein